MKRRKNSLRLPDYDYSLPGAYFITLCTQHRLHLFGHICDGKMILNEFGKIVEEVWINLPNHYPNMECGEFVVMPNHVHGVVILKSIDHTKGGFENTENAKEGRFQTCPNEPRPNVEQTCEKGGSIHELTLRIKWIRAA